VDRLQSEGTRRQPGQSVCGRNVERKYFQVPNDKSDSDATRHHSADGVIHVEPDTCSARQVKLFISSTWADLQDYVREAERVLEAAGITYVQFKHWESTGRPSVSECLDRVDACDALIVIVGADYGWVPPEEQGGDGRSSITWLEVQRARNAPKPVLPFFIEDASLSARPASQEVRERFAEFVAEMRKGVGPTVGSIAAFGGSLRMSVEKLQAKLAIPGSVPSSVGEPTQAVGLTFLDREQPRARLLDALTNATVRGATIVGKGGFGKS